MLSRARCAACGCILIGFDTRVVVTWSVCTIWQSVMKRKKEKERCDKTIQKLKDELQVRIALHEPGLNAASGDDPEVGAGRSSGVRC